mgnify:FL=1
MLITLTLNPAVDKTIYLNDFAIGEVNRPQKVRKDAGGKGINVSKVAAKLDHPTTAFGFLGGAAGEFIKNEINKLQIKQDFVELNDETRTNLKIVDQDDHIETEINEAGAKVTTEELAALKKRVLAKASAGDSLVLTGSLPPGVPDDIYAELIKKLQEKDVKTFLDASDTALKEGIKAKPFLVKPNQAELERLVGRELFTLEDIITAAKRIQNNGPKIVVISRGSQGSLAISTAGNFKITAPEVEPHSTIGAGDTLVAALAIKLEAGLSLSEALRYSAAASANSVTQPGTQLCKPDEIADLIDKVKVTEI